VLWDKETNTNQGLSALQFYCDFMCIILIFLLLLFLACTVCLWQINVSIKNQMSKYININWKTTQKPWWWWQWWWWWLWWRWCHHTKDNIYGALIMAQLVWEFTQLIRWMQNSTKTPLKRRFRIDRGDLFAWELILFEAFWAGEA